MPSVVVLAEDDERQSEFVRRYLERDEHTVRLARTGPDAVAAVRRHHPDLLILDVMMPGLDGLQVCELLRRESDLAILMLTARSTEEDLLAGLECGADDYLTKPFSPRELAARVRALLRRGAHPAAAPPDPCLRAGDVVLDPGRHELWVRGRPVECTPAEFRLLEAFATNPGQALTRWQLLQLMNGFDTEMTERTIDFHVKNLRRKVEVQPRRPRCLVTVYGVGYKLTADPGHAG